MSPQRTILINNNRYYKLKIKYLLKKINIYLDLVYKITNNGRTNQDHQWKWIYKHLHIHDASYYFILHASTFILPTPTATQIIDSLIPNKQALQRQSTLKKTFPAMLPYLVSVTKHNIIKVQKN